MYMGHSQGLLMQSTLSERKEIDPLPLGRGTFGVSALCIIEILGIGAGSFEDAYNHYGT